tara:strand:- start:2708 stop:3103 length:396 start_codon:yes stop_codon:yes gene_type:complete
MAIGYDAELPLKYNSVDGFYALSKTIKDNIQQNIRMLMLTTPGERMMLPGYGVGLRNYLFEIAPERQIFDKIKEQLDLFLPEIRVVSLNIKKGQNLMSSTGQDNSLFIRMEYLIPDTDLLQTFQLLETSIM